jgi:hypothetical protein
METLLYLELTFFYVYVTVLIGLLVVLMFRPKNLTKGM